MEIGFQGEKANSHGNDKPEQPAQGRPVVAGKDQHKKRSGLRYITGTEQMRDLKAGSQNEHARG